MARSLAAQHPAPVAVAQVRGALARLYDPGALAAHPLAAAAGGGRGLRRALEEAVDALKPPRDGRPAPQVGRRHELLRLRYLEGLPVEEVQRRLLIGHAEYYREHAQALEAVAALLRGRLAPGDPPMPTAPMGTAPAGQGEPTATLPVPLTGFVGRAAELAELRGLLAGARLLTLVGAGGVGKTRLAVELARGASGAHAGGLSFVDLAPLADPALVPGALLAALGLPESPGRPPVETVGAHLGARAALVVLDNCEHVVDAAARLVEALLRGCPSLTVLATSREPLGVGGEVRWRVPPLAMPAADEAAPAAHDAVRLFVERAAAVKPGFALTPETAPVVAAICRRLDGIPLAIELAAARVALLSPGQVVARLEDRFRLLTGGARTALPRQQTLRASLDWSHDLLAEPEQALFRRLAVFAGGWPLEAGEAVGSDDGADGAEVLDLLGQLVDKSLVLAETSGGQERYRLLETVREYAAARLTAAGEEAAVRGRHRDWCLALAEEAAPALWGPGQSTWAERLESDHANLRAALGWCLDNDPDAAVRLGAALWRFWQEHAHHAEGGRWLESALAAAPTPTVHRARALLGAAVLAAANNDAARQRALSAEGAALFRALGDRAGLGHALNARGGAELSAGDLAAARRTLEEALDLSRAADDRPRLGWNLKTLAELAVEEGESGRARSLYGQSLAVFRETGERMGVGVVLQGLGLLAAREGDTARARALYEEALAINREHGDRVRAGLHLEVLGFLAWAEGDGASARALLQESFALLREGAHASWVARGLYVRGVRAVQRGAGVRGVRLAGAAVAMHPPVAAGEPVLLASDRVGAAALLGAARGAAGEEAVAAAWAAGQALTQEQAIAEALAWAEGASTAAGQAVPDERGAAPVDQPETAG